MKRDALQPGVSPREVWAWAAFDFANSGYTTVVLTAVFNAYFVSVVCGGADWATFAWTCVVAASNAVGMAAMPLIGALADAKAQKKRWLFAATALCIAGTVGLAFSGPGTIAWAAAMVVVSNLGYNVGETLNSAFLPELAKPQAVGKVSGWGWSFGYCGGIVTLGLSLLLVIGAERFGLTAQEAVSGTLLITAAVFAAAAAPLFLWVKERSAPRESASGCAGVLSAGLQSFRDVAHTLQSLPRFRDFACLAVCGFCYQCGVAVVITLSAVYAAAVMGFTTEDTIRLVFLVNITAAVGAFGFGYLQDRLGHKLTLALTLCLWLAMIAAAALAEGRGLFWAAANLAGLAMGSSQSAGRAMVALLAPKKRLAEFFSFWNMMLWAAAIVGPLFYGAVSWSVGNNHRLALWATGLFFAAALLMLAPLDLARGKRAAQAADAEAG